MFSFTLRMVVAGALVCLPALAVDRDWVDLLPDSTFKGWTRVPIPPVDGVKPEMQWRVDAAARTVICSGKGQHEWLRYDTELGDFVLEVEWRFTPLGPEEKKYNSGIGIRMSKFAELWHQAQTGPTGGFLFGQNLVDGLMARYRLSDQMKENRVKPAGEWNRYVITAKGDRITLEVNGAVVNEVTGVCLRRGYVGLEGEGYEITFRKMRVRALD